MSEIVEKDTEQEIVGEETSAAKKDRHGGEGRRNTRERRNDDKKEESQFIEKLISVRRVTKVVKGGKNMRFSALMVVGDGKGKVAYASAKAREVPDAIKKAALKAKSSLMKVPLKHGKTFHYDTKHASCSSKVYIRSAKPGTGVIAGGAMRAIFEALGAQDVVAKRLGTNNSYNVVRATFNALKVMESPRQVAKRRGLQITEMNERKKALSGRIEKNVK
ncbi:MAG: 30S ribosomal protein S5 [Alphaproteobacteria bacterium]|nr:MAG: 30S ribosomal protein S5 [Alphaproteobacteria bacterium]